MSNALRIALVAEGWTDKIVVEAAISELLGGPPFALKLLQPEDPAASAPFSAPRPFGWAGVYRWCREVVDRAGRLRDDVVFASYDVLIIHLDADVADSNRDYRLDARFPCWASVTLSENCVNWIIVL